MTPDDAAPSGSRLRTVAARAITGILGLPPVANGFARRHASSLRVLAYHVVPDAAAFDRQLDLLSASYRVVGEAQVRDALAGGAPLPERALWITFDDGDPSVVADGLPVLTRRGLSTTVFVCPGLVEEGAPAWWTVVAAASRAGASFEVGGRRLSGQPLITALKGVPDVERREAVDALAEAASGRPPEPAALTRADLERWVDAGGTVGNHTWDHPCLDQCDVATQRRQITDAHEWFRSFQPDRLPVFAYPNGDRTDDAEAVLAELGYDLALLFDHRLASLDANPLRTSRLRLDTDSSAARTRAVASGVHSAVLGRMGG